MTVDLSVLTTAADRWEGMAQEFHTQERAYDRDVHGISMGPTWSGLSADAANRRFDITLEEFRKAQTEAKAVASLLREAHHRFAEVRKELTSARADAIRAGMAVSAEGVVSFDTTDLTTGERNALTHDPSYQESVRQAVTAWQEHLDRIVKDAEKADHSVQTALHGVVIDSAPTDGTPTGFNGDAKDHLKDYRPVAKDGEKPGGWQRDWKWTLDEWAPSFSASADPKYGKEGSIKSGFDLFHLSGKGALTNGDFELAGVLDFSTGGRGSANYGFSDKGLSAKAEISAASRGLAEFRVGYGEYGGVYERGDAFAGGEAGVTAKVTKDNIGLNAKAFYGAKASHSTGIEVAGIGIGVTHEIGAGEGVEYDFGIKKREDGTWKANVGGFASEVVGAGAGAEITFDPGKFTKTAGDAADAVGLGGAARTVGHGAKSLKDTVTGWFD
ncbi:hypothetical protein [Streptomyces sp. NPDC046939]|uniref:hypothetical protein n=1 Tax=Streptomyces sp. NPDC046939 TaxID=3155376 RepID=UPI0033C23271